MQNSTPRPIRSAWIASRSSTVRPSDIPSAISPASSPLCLSFRLSDPSSGAPHRAAKVVERFTCLLGDLPFVSELGDLEDHRRVRLDDAGDPRELLREQTEQLFVGSEKDLDNQIVRAGRIPDVAGLR